MDLKHILLLVQISLTLAQISNVQKVITANNRFVLDIYVRIANDKPNFIFSAFSAETILALTQAGSHGATRQQLRSALHLPNSTQEINEGFKSLLTSLNNQNTLIFRSANKIYVNAGFSINQNFTNTAVSDYNAGVENIDFSQNQQAAQTINNWVEDQTEDKIKNLITPDSLSSLTRLVLVNALYLRGNWSKPFLKRNTCNESFYTSATNVVQVPTMHETGYYNYYENVELKLKILQITLGTPNASVIFVLPTSRGGLATIKEQDSFRQGLSFNLLRKEYVKVSLPKFKIESSVTFTPILKSLGVVDAFSPSKADLSGISGNEGLFISDVVQKAYVGVDENGIEAAAATAVLVTTSVVISNPAPKIFQANQPFIILIEVDGVFAFAGTVSDPSKQ